MVAWVQFLTRDGDFAYYVDIASFMADRPLPAGHTAPQWLDGEPATRAVARVRHRPRNHLGAAL
ncbi:hypothetical protein AB0P36_34345 [Streptomyces flavidovirens]|uniref:hypothetical protein n=1 Tax=Streptomyces flavidovirens TaxID=67298 RepID=UPI003439ADC9